MIPWIGRATTIVALCLALGFQWFALQSVAWATMLAANARHAPLTEAVAKTFDGAHPCMICHAVAAGKTSGKKSDFPTTGAKMDLICATLTLAWERPSEPFDYAPTQFAIPKHLPTPPVPPPRSLPL
jgi:hypothetical protein